MSAAQAAGATDGIPTMNPRSFFLRFQRIPAPAALLAAFLQRTPAVPPAALVANYALESPGTSVLKAVAASVAALGAVNSVAGASASTATLVADIQVPASVVQGQPFKLDVTVTGVAVTFAKSWDVTNTLPPGITVQGATLVGNLWVIADATATNGVLTILGTATQAGLYNFTVEAWQNTNRSGSVTPGTTSINVTAPAGSIATITTQPRSQVVDAGSSVTFSVVASATQAISYHWYKDSSPISGATNASLSIPSVQVGDAGTYSVLVTTAGGSITSQAAFLTVNNVNAVPVFSLEPDSQTIPDGATVVFNSLASGAPLPTYHWAFNGAPISGASGPTLLISGATSANAGNYTCIASNSVGATTSASAKLEVSSTPNIGRLVNISCRAPVGTGGNIRDRWICRGRGGDGTSGSETVFARASGPGAGALRRHRHPSGSAAPSRIRACAPVLGTNRRVGRGQLTDCPRGGTRRSAHFPGQTRQATTPALCRERSPPAAVHCQYIRAKRRHRRRPG